MKTSWRYLCKRSWRGLEDVLNTFWRRLEDVLKVSVLKTSSEDIWLRRIYLSWSRRLEDVLKTSSEDEDERRLHQDECLVGLYCVSKFLRFKNVNFYFYCELNFCWEVFYLTFGNPAFCLALYLTGVHFRRELQHVGDISEQKIKCRPISTWEIGGARLQDKLHADHRFISVQLISVNWGRTINSNKNTANCYWLTYLKSYYM